MVTVVSYVVPLLLLAMFEWFWNILYNLGTSEQRRCGCCSRRQWCLLSMPLQTARVVRRCLSLLAKLVL